jgi:hypothetical protein
MVAMGVGTIGGGKIFVLLLFFGWILHLVDGSCLFGWAEL